jgi:hypothetical protein
MELQMLQAWQAHLLRWDAVQAMLLLVLMMMVVWLGDGHSFQPAPYLLWLYC